MSSLLLGRRCGVGGEMLPYEGPAIGLAMVSEKGSDRMAPTAIDADVDATLKESETPPLSLY